jgi:hypothetical protein
MLERLEPYMRNFLCRESKQRESVAPWWLRQLPLEWEVVALRKTKTASAWLDRTDKGPYGSTAAKKSRSPVD